MGVIPKKITSYKLNIASIPELVSIDITLTEVSSSDLNKESSHCSEEDRVDFNTCSQIYLASYFNDKVNCTLPGNSLGSWFFAAKTSPSIKCLFYFRAQKALQNWFLLRECVWALCRGEVCVCGCACECLKLGAQRLCGPNICPRECLPIHMKLLTINFF